MGAYLDKPNEEKNPEYGTHNQCWWGVCAMQGWRCNMEDAHICENIDLPRNQKGMLFAVFDGHGGREVALYAKQRFKSIFTSQQAFKSGDYEKALEAAFIAFDEEVGPKDYAGDTGTTSCVVLITPTVIFCANAGDSRAVLKSADRVVPLSFDHKPDNLEEQTRIQRANHFVSMSRVDANLALSRAFGDFQYKDQPSLGPSQQAVSCVPDILKRQRSKDDKFIMLACDGIWDCLTNEACISTLSEKVASIENFGNKQILSQPIEEVFTEILAPSTEDGVGTDNMTAILIYFPDNLGIS